jgi:hypothetical protein
MHIETGLIREPAEIRTTNFQTHITDVIASEYRLGFPD